MTRGKAVILFLCCASSVALFSELRAQPTKTEMCDDRWNRCTTEADTIQEQCRARCGGNATACKKQCDSDHRKSVARCDTAHDICLKSR
jgi:hypothetical protein